MDSTPKKRPAEESVTGPTQETDVKIDNNTIKNVTPARSKEAKSLFGQRLQPAEPPKISDEVKLTATSEKLLQLENELSTIDVTDNAKIESIRQAIADGKFKVDEEVVADKLIEESINNIGHRSR
jgi:negative regulator of flagellin synthesis FlgM